MPRAATRWYDAAMVVRWVLLLVLCGLAGGCGGSHGPSYSAAVSVSFPPDQHVGAPAPLVVTIRNTGDAMPDVAVRVPGPDHAYAVLTVNTDTGEPAQRVAPDAWALGPMSQGKTVNVSIVLAPARVGHFTLYPTVYADRAKRDTLTTDNLSISATVR